MVGSHVLGHWLISRTGHIPWKENDDPQFLELPPGAGKGKREEGEEEERYLYAGQPSLSDRADSNRWNVTVAVNE